MLPVVGTSIAPFAIYEAILASRIIRIRRTKRISLDNKLREQPPDKPNVDPLTVAIRAHSNFVEGVPFAFLIAIIAELNGCSKMYLGLSLALLFIGRIMHVEKGLLRNRYAAGFGRTFGTSVTQGFICLWSLVSLYLVWS